MRVTSIFVKRVSFCKTFSLCVSFCETLCFAFELFSERRKAHTEPKPFRNLYSVMRCIVCNSVHTRMLFHLGLASAYILPHLVAQTASCGCKLSTLCRFTLLSQLIYNVLTAKQSQAKSVLERKLNLERQHHSVKLVKAPNNWDTRSIAMKPNPIADYADGFGLFPLRVKAPVRAPQESDGKAVDKDPAGPSGTQRERGNWTPLDSTRLHWTRSENLHHNFAPVARSTRSSLRREQRRQLLSSSRLEWTQTRCGCKSIERRNDSTVWNVCNACKVCNACNACRCRHTFRQCNVVQCN